MEDIDWGPDKRTFEAHLKSVRFVAGIEEDRWQILNSDFPHLYVRVMGKDSESGASFTHDFHLVCDGYPLPGPFVERWNFESKSRPPPPVIAYSSPGFCDAMKDWEQVQGVHGGIYRSWQRHAAVHNDWAQKRPDEAWHRERELTFIMERLYDLVAEQAIWLGCKTEAA